MEYFVGAALALGAGVLATVAGFDRDRSLYPVILVVIASYYDLFAITGGGAALAWETGVFAAFLAVAIIGFRTSLWLVVVALAGHGLFDWYHGRWIENAGVPAWWPMWCLGYDAAAAAYLAWRLLSGKIDATDPASFGRRIHSYVEAEFAAANAAELGGDRDSAFHHLERAHVLGQRSTAHHVRAHMRMLMWAMRHRDLREVIGQILRIIGAAAGPGSGSCRTAIPEAPMSVGSNPWRSPMISPARSRRRAIRHRPPLTPLDRGAIQAHPAPGHAPTRGSSSEYPGAIACAQGLQLPEKHMKNSAHRFSVAPMMDWTDRA